MTARQPDSQPTLAAVTTPRRRLHDGHVRPSDGEPSLPEPPCWRCDGLMVPCYTNSLEPRIEGIPIAMWRCINCGECLDTQILANRSKQHPSRDGLVGPRKRGLRRHRPRGRSREVDRRMVEVVTY